MWISVKDDVECVGRDVLPYFILILYTTDTGYIPYSFKIFKIYVGVS